jgi:plasmid stabilization system protein ParE
MAEKKPPEETQSRADKLRARTRQLILMRETGPKRAAWHQARMRMIWRLHDELRAAQADEGDSA